jgi:hypothetical protein
MSESEEEDWGADESSEPSKAQLELKEKFNAAILKTQPGVKVLDSSSVSFVFGMNFIKASESDAIKRTEPMEVKKDSKTSSNNGDVISDDEPDWNATGIDSGEDSKTQSEKPMKITGIKADPSAQVEDWNTDFALDGPLTGGNNFQNLFQELN